MSEVLSQSEIDALLTAINAGDCEPEDFRPAINNRRVRIYDFKRPDKFSREQIRYMSMIHEYFARDVTDDFTALLKDNLHFHVASVDQLTFEEFIRSIPTPTTLGILSLAPVQDDVTFAPNGILIEIDPSISQALVTSSIGGDENCIIRQPITDLEYNILEDFLVRLTCDMRSAWSSIADVRPIISCMEENPAFCKLCEPGEMGCLVTIEAKVKSVEGMLNVFYPYETVKPVLSRLNSQHWYSKKTEHVPSNFNLDDMLVTLRFESFRKIETLGTLMNTKIGDTIWSNHDLTYTTGKVMMDDIYVYKAALLGPQQLGPKRNRIRLDAFKNIKEDNYMETKNNVNDIKLNLNDVQVQLSVELGRARILVRDLLTWGEGTIIELDKLAGEPADVFANNVLIAKGEIVAIDDAYGVRITEIMNPKE
jgi:flagellar motor switch protein FliM